MIRLLIFLMLLLSCEAQVKESEVANSSVKTNTAYSETDTITILKAEIVFLKAQLAEANMMFAYQDQVCRAGDLMQARLARMQAEAKLKEVKEPKKPVAP